MKIEKSALLADGSMICWGRKMMCLEKGKHTRGAEFRTPPYAGHDASKSEIPPAITVTIYAPKSVGPVFVAYQIKVNFLDEERQTQITVHAQNMELCKPSDLDFWCSFTAIGKPFEAVQQARSRRRKA